MPDLVGRRSLGEELLWELEVAGSDNPIKVIEAFLRDFAERIDEGEALGHYFSVASPFGGVTVMNAEATQIIMTQRGTLLSFETIKAVVDADTPLALGVAVVADEFVDKSVYVQPIVVQLTDDTGAVVGPANAVTQNCTVMEAPCDGDEFDDIVVPILDTSTVGYMNNAGEITDAGLYKLRLDIGFYASGGLPL